MFQLKSTEEETVVVGRMCSRHWNAMVAGAQGMIDGTKQGPWLPLLVNNTLGHLISSASVVPGVND